MSEHIFYEMHCIKCNKQNYKVYISHLAEGVFCLGWTCNECGQEGPQVPIEDGKPLKGLMEYHEKKGKV